MRDKLSICKKYYVLPIKLRKSTIKSSVNKSI